MGEHTGLPEILKKTIITYPFLLKQMKILVTIPSPLKTCQIGSKEQQQKKVINPYLKLTKENNNAGPEVYIHCS